MLALTLVALERDDAAARRQALARAEACADKQDWSAADEAWPSGH